MIDLHFHALPEIDDGPVTVQESLALARAAVDAGTREIACTSHVTTDLPNDAATIGRAVADLQERLDSEGVPLLLRTGGEVALTRAAELTDDELHRLHLGGGEWLLAECPLRPGVAGFDVLLHHLQARGHRILLAHPERSPGLQRDPAKVRALVDAGMLASVNTGSLTGEFGSAVQRFAFALVEEGLVHNVASDAHDVDRRPPGLSAPIAEADAELPGLAEQAEWLTVDVPRAILDGGPVPPRPGEPPQRRRRRLLRRALRRR